MKYKKNFKTTVIININNQLLEKQRNNIVGEETTDGERKDKTHSKVDVEKKNGIHSKVTNDNVIKAHSQIVKKKYFKHFG